MSLGLPSVKLVEGDVVCESAVSVTDSSDAELAPSPEPPTCALALPPRSGVPLATAKYWTAGCIVAAR